LLDQNNKINELLTNSSGLKKDLTGTFRDSFNEVKNTSLRETLEKIHESKMSLTNELNTYKTSNQKEFSELVASIKILESDLKNKYEQISKTSGESKNTLTEIKNIFQHNKQRGTVGEFILENILRNHYGEIPA
jgi:DNA anti-recombination protein RmuC